MTAQAQLVLDARAATGRSVQVIKPFMHSSTHPQAFCASRLGKVTAVYHCFCWTLISLLPSFLSVLSCTRCLSFFLINPRLYLLSASLFSHTFTLANTLTSEDSATHYLKVCTAPSVLCTLPLVSHPQRVSITSSHSEAKEGMRSMDGCPDLQLDTDPLRPARPPSSSPSGDANKSESDLDKLRVRPRSAGLALKAATGAETSLESLVSAFGLWSTLAGLPSGAQSAIVLELPSAARGPQFGVQQSELLFNPANDLGALSEDSTSGCWNPVSAGTERHRWMRHKHWRPEKCCLCTVWI